MPDLHSTSEAWYCLKALPKKEHIAAQLIRRDVGLEAFAPQLSYLKNTRRGRVRFKEALFPAYLFVHGDLKQHYRHLKSIQGVRDLVTYGETVPTVPDSFIEGIRARFPDEVVETKDLSIRPGMEVTIADGPFQNWDAIVQGLVPARDRVVLLLDFLGRQLKVELPHFSVVAHQSESPREQVWSKKSEE